MNGRDATIIGAGPAGSLAAMLLARGGWRVTLIEQHSFPRDKVCGECLSALGIAVLRRAGFAAWQRRCALLSHTAVFAPNGRAARLRLDPPMWGISRLKMDHWLLEEARHAGAEILQPARCESLQAGDPPTLIVRDLRSNHVQTLRPSVVLVADGKGSLFWGRKPTTGDFGIKAHYRHVDAPRDTIGLFGFQGYYGGVAPIEDDLWNVALSVPISELRRAHGDLDQLFAAVLRQNTALSQQFTGARRCSAWLAAPLPRFPVGEQWPPGVIPLGNAAAALEPVGGEGIGLALRSAELAAEMLVNARGDPASLRNAFRYLWRRRATACRFAASILSRPRLCGPIIALVAKHTFLGNIALRCLGKSRVS